MKLRYQLSRAALAFLLLLSFVGGLPAETPAPKPLLHPLFCDHAVLQRNVAVPVWGWTEPGATVTVNFAGQTLKAVADADGKWMVKLKPMPASAEPRTLKVSSSAKQQSVSISDVLVGDVWLCSGQSNMEMGIELCKATNDILTANFPQIRLLTVPKQAVRTPLQTVDCHWLPCSPETIQQGAWGGFSAAAFYFGRDLYRQLNIPIGLIHSSWGGTIAEAWTSREGLQPLGDFDAALAMMEPGKKQMQPADYAVIYEAWCQAKDPGSRQHWEKITAAEDSWKTVSMPQPFEQAGLPDFDGIVWFRREIELPENWAGQALTLDLGPVDDIDTTWVNGVKVGQMNRFDLFRSYAIPANVLKPGRNVVTVRVLDTGGIGGFTGQAGQMHLAPTNDKQATPVSLAGTWQMRDSAPLSQLPGMPPLIDDSNPNHPTLLYNGMIAPLLPFAIKGAIWYQGESNADRAQQYRRLLPALIKDWRARFGVGDFPFYIVQLAAFQATNAEPRDNNWAELREAQALTAQTVRNSGLAVAIDIGDANDIHPKDKQSVGHRLALCALAKDYGKKIEYSGPVYHSMSVTRDGIRLKFDHVDGGLVAKGDKLTGFAIAGPDHKFVWADAVIQKNAVVVSSPKVPQPVAVRYAWDVNPVCNLYNQSGLPAVPFRTDNWPMITAGRK